MYTLEIFLCELGKVYCTCQVPGWSPNNYTILLSVLAVIFFMIILKYKKPFSSAIKIFI